MLFLFDDMLGLLGIILLGFLLWDRHKLKVRIERIEKILEKSDTSPVTPVPVTPATFVSGGFQTTPSATVPLNNQDFLPAAIAPVPASGGDFETAIGQRWLPIVGVLAVVIGASFFLKYAFENNIIGVTGRVVLGFLGGLIFVSLGEFWRKKYQKYSWILSGGGIALFYLSVFAAFAYYHLISQTGAFSFMAIVTVFSGALAIRYNASYLAVVGTLGGFLTPFLLSTGVDNQAGLFAYIALLNGGILCIAFFRQWRGLQLLGLVGTFVTYAAWHSVYYLPEKIFLTEFFLIVFFAEFLLATIISDLISSHPSTPDDLGLLTANAAWFFGWSYILFNPEHHAVLGVFVALLAAIYVGLAYATLTLKKNDVSLSLFLGGIALVLLTLVFPIQLVGVWITVAWAAEAAVLCAVGFFVKNQKIRIAAVLVLCVTVVRLLAYDTDVRDIAAYTLIFNKRFLAYGITIGALWMMQYLYAQRNQEGEAGNLAGEEKIFPGLFVLWNILLLVLFSLETSAYFDRRISQVARVNVPIAPYGINDPGYGAGYPRGYGNTQEYFPDDRTPVLPYGFPPNAYPQPSYVQSDFAAQQILRNQRNAALSVLWALYATALLVAGMMRKNKHLRLGALVLFGVTLAKVVLIDLASLPTLYRFISFMVVGVLLLIGSYLYYRNQPRISSPPSLSS